MKHYFSILLLSFVIFSCKSGPALVPVDSSQSLDSGRYVEVTVTSPLVKDQFKELQAYLEEKLPRVLPIELDYAFASETSDVRMVLVCSYESGTQSTWLKADLLLDDQGAIIAREIVTSYDINLLGEDF